MKRFLFRHTWPWGFVYLACAPLVSGQSPLTIRSIRVTTVGTVEVGEALIRANMRVKEGEPFSTSAITADIQHLYDTGYFRNIQVSEERTPDGINLTYLLEAKPRITEITYQGNKRYKNRKLATKVKSKVGETLDDRKLFADAQAIKEMYVKAGYPGTKVTPKITNIDEARGRGSVMFEITESPKVKITGVDFPGGAAFSNKELRKTIKTRKRWWLSWVTGSGVLKEDQIEEDREKLAAFYQNKGYIDFEIKDVSYTYDGTTKVHVVFDVNEGKQYRLGQIRVAGTQLLSSDQLMAEMKMKPADLFTPKGLRENLKSVQDAYGRRGYIDARVSASEDANTQTGNMDLTVTVDEGEQSFIERIDIRGNIKTKDKVIRRELAVAPGEVFDMTRVDVSKRRLEGLNYFEDNGGVEMQAEPTDVANRKDLLVALKEKNTGNFTIGAGFSSVDSILGFVEVSQGNFDLFKPPYFMGAGQKFRLRAQLGSERKDFLLSFVEPWFLERKLAMSVDLYHRELSYQSLNDLYDERRSGGRVGFSRALGSDFLIGTIGYTLENVGIVNVSPLASPTIKAEEGIRLVSKIGASIAYDTRDSSMMPTRGARSEFLTEYAGGPLGGETDFYKLEARTAWYFKGFSPGHVLEVVGRAGVVDSHGDSTRVPLFDRWFLGGMGTLRGYRYRQVGPLDETGEPTGGNTYWFGSLEYSIPVMERLRMAFFYDIGMVYEDAYNWNFQHYNDNFGIGLRINLPIGPLRLDYGIPINDSDGKNDTSGRFNFGIGYSREF